MNRRDAIQHISLLMGGTLVGGSYLLSGCKNPDAGTMEFTADDIAYLNEIADTILPTTKSPGAKAANVGQAMTVIVKDCYDEKDQKIFHEGMDKLNVYSKKKFDKAFMKLDAPQRHDLLVALDKEANEYQKNKKSEEPSHHFRMMKELTLLCYFTSEVGCTQALRYMERPGRYEGCVPYKPGDKAWA